MQYFEHSPFVMQQHYDMYVYNVGTTNLKQSVYSGFIFFFKNSWPLIRVYNFIFMWQEIKTLAFTQYEQELVGSYYNPQPSETLPMVVFGFFVCFFSFMKVGTSLFIIYLGKRD